MTEETLLWGAASIGEAIDKDPRQTFHLLETGQIPARKVGGRWVASKERLLSHILDGDDDK